MIGKRGKLIRFNWVAFCALFLCPFISIDRMVCRGCILPSEGIVQHRWRTYREIPLEGVIAAFSGVTGGGWIDRIPPRCHRAKMRRI